VDLRLSPEGEPYVLEVNTAPGMTGTSLVPKAARAMGWEFPELLARIAESSAGIDRRLAGR
jgi:D-alanine-D-alanine ligase